MGNPVFILGANSFTFSKGVDYPVRAPREQIQAMDRTAAGTLEVEVLGLMIKRLAVSFSNLPYADFNALRNWFDLIAAGAANAFTYTDQDENTFSVRWVNQFDFLEDKAGYSGTIELEIVG
jgi:hypothetical protein